MVKLFMKMNDKNFKFLSKIIDVITAWIITTQTDKTLTIFIGWKKNMKMRHDNFPQSTNLDRKDEKIKS